MNYIITNTNGPPPNSIPVISNGLINITTSSQHDANHSIRGLPLNEPKIDGNSHSFCFLGSDPRKKLIFGSTTIQNFVAFAIRGRGDSHQWVQQFILRYTINGIDWLDINGGIHLSGNYDQNTIITHVFEPPIRALAISFEVLTFNVHPSLRCELYITPITTSIDDIIQTSSLTLNSRHFSALPDIQNLNLNSSGVSTSNNNSPNETVFYENTTRIHFGKEFSRVPNVQLGITSIQNLPNIHNSKITIQPINITTKDFDVYIKTSIKIKSIDIQYTANLN
ncbi:discoidin I [Tieghemostelium lacteum]|uniref:Discoidin I n=1 Tax=Tieghemostelium lacteum TaxID=361077 RepID=A0A152A7B6_TIELA|nr:discoidin I [Tieghemostelium lacteum]|eukprot:KYR02143.1 discoidin I [Tieghemostelium lacteum]